MSLQITHPKTVYQISHLLASEEETIRIFWSDRIVAENVFRQMGPLRTIFSTSGNGMKLFLEVSYKCCCTQKFSCEKDFCCIKLIRNILWSLQLVALDFNQNSGKNREHQPQQYKGGRRQPIRPIIRKVFDDNLSE